MPRVVLSELFARLSDDTAFRERFAADPKTVLREAGFDTDHLDLPSSIDPDEIARKATRIRRGDDDLIGSEDELATLSPDELWSRFAIIRARPGAGLASVATAVVYGTTAVAVIAATGAGGGAPGMLSESQARQLRAIESWPADDLRFTVTGPDGVTLRDIDAVRLADLLKRMEP